MRLRFVFYRRRKSQDPRLTLNFIHRKGAPYLEAVNKRVTWLHEMGIIALWIKEVTSLLSHKQKQNYSLLYNVSQVSVLFSLALALVILFLVMSDEGG